MKNKIDFLQSEEWRKFQESTGKRTSKVSSDEFWANIIEHKLPIVGKYFYIPKGPVVGIRNHETRIINELIGLAKKESAGWIRIEPADEEILAKIKRTLCILGHKVSKIKKAPHDMQPREILVIDIMKPEEQLLNEMKPKTRYNMRLAEKKGVKILSESRALGKQYFEEFLRLIKITCKRDGIVPHPENYYRKMVEIIPEDNLKLYAAEYQGKIIAANLVIFYGNTATYLHGASDNEHRNVMAPYLLQWRQIQDAKKAGYTKYNFGGVKTNSHSSWAGITKFKTGFSPNTKTTEFPGSYDIIINSFKYKIYRFLQKIKNIL